MSSTDADQPHPLPTLPPAGATMASAKPAGKAGAKVPASIAKLSMEELQSMCVDTLKKLRARDKRIEVSIAAATHGNLTCSPVLVKLASMKAWSGTQFPHIQAFVF